MDYGPYNEADPALQERAFREQLAIARDAGLPCELHIRDASDDPACSAHALAERVLGEDGIPDGELERATGRVLHVTPYHSFPSGVTASMERRGAYLRWTRERQGILV